MEIVISFAVVGVVFFLIGRRIGRYQGRREAIGGKR